TKREEKPEFPGGSSGRNLRHKPAKASSTTAMRGDTHPSTMQLMEAVVERSNGGASFTVKSEAWCLKDDLNRRIRNRTSGGVGGRGAFTGAPPTRYRVCRCSRCRPTRERNGCPITPADCNRRSPGRGGPPI